MRQVQNVESKKHIDPKKLPSDMIIQLGSLLDDPKTIHIEKVYFTADGEYYFVAHEYAGNDKRWKGKKYARFAYKTVEVMGIGGQKEMKRYSLPIDEYEIVEEYDADWLVREYIKLSKKK